MRGAWGFRSFRPVHCADRFPVFGRFPVRRAGKPCTIVGTEREALAFAQRAAAYLSAKAVQRVEAWSVGPVESTEDELPLTIFQLKAHPDGRHWIAEQGPLHHGGVFPDLDSAINYALFRGSGRLCAVQILAKSGRPITIVLVDQHGVDHCPIIAPSVGNRHADEG